MPHTIKFNKNLNIIETSFDGLILAEEIIQVMNEAAELAEKNKCNLLLNNYTDAKTKVSVMDIYNFPKEFKKVSETFIKNKFSIKRAIVGDSKTNDFKFAETVAFNLGQRMKVFSNLEDARQWLIND